MRMLKRIGFILTLIPALLLLQSCSFMGMGDGMSSHADNEFNDLRDNRMRAGGGGYYHAPVRVPESYHFADGQSPTKHKARDSQWIKNQDPHHYTIDVGTSDRASAVAKRLHKSPKTSRAAQFRYKNADKTYHTGVYGSFKSKEDAEKALNNLPADVRGNAKVKGWGQVQQKAKQAISNGSERRVGPPSME